MRSLLRQSIRRHYQMHLKPQEAIIIHKSGNKAQSLRLLFLGGLVSIWNRTMPISSITMMANESKALNAI